jgi:dihydroorotase
MEALPMMRALLVFGLLLGLADGTSAQEYDLLLKGGHVIDARSQLSAVRDVAIKDGKVAAVSAGIPAASALKTVDVSGLYVVPGLIDIHAHVYRPTVGAENTAEASAVYPDGFSFRNGVTTFVDPGGAGWRNFEDMKNRVIDRSQTRVLAMINIIGRGSAANAAGSRRHGGGAAARWRSKHSLIVGEELHFGTGMAPPSEPSRSGRANIPVMTTTAGAGDGRCAPAHPRPGPATSHVTAGSGASRTRRRKVRARR